MGLFKKKERADILPLSCNPELNYEYIPGIDAYYRDLNAVFDNPRIKNIAVAGQRGVGKSSLIRSFDTSRRGIIKRNPKFLYVSLGEYRQDTQNDESVEEEPSMPDTQMPVSTCKVTVGTQEFQLTLDAPDRVKKAEEDQKQEESENTAKQNAIERRILLQLCSKFPDKHFPAGGFRQIPKKPGMFATVGFVSFVMSILMLMLKSRMGELLFPWKQTCWLIDQIVKWNDQIELGLYGVVCLGCMILLAKGYQWIRLRGVGTSLAVKTDNVELGVEERVAEDYLDQYTQELVYYLSQVGGKIDRTVVFEDMDRLDNEMCMRIFTRLREINHILNTHLGPKQYIRFVFVIDDGLAQNLVFDKFFDYVMPVIPTLNHSSSRAIFLEKLKEVHTALECTIKKDSLGPVVGIRGAHVIVYLDKHPLLKESCCHFRSICRAVKEKWDRMVSKITTWVRAHPKIKRIIGVPVTWLKKLVTAVRSFLQKCKKILATIPVNRYFFRWIEKKRNERVRWFGKVKALLCYHEPKKACGSCDQSVACSSVCIRKMEDDTDGIVQIAAEALTDYRLMFTILNEYSLMVRMYHSNNREGVSCKVSEHVLAFQIYKHLWPEDYQKLLSDNHSESVLYTKSTANVRWRNKKLLQKMLNRQMLSLDSLHYAGFSRDKIASIWKKRLENESFENVIKDMDPNNSMHQGLVREHCRFSNGNQVTNEGLGEAIRFVLRQSDLQPSANDWFFEGRDGSECIGILAGMEDNSMGGFVKQCITEKPWNIFEKCSNKGCQLVPSGEWTEQMALVCAAGVHPAKRTAARTGKKVRLNPVDGRTISFDSFDPKINELGIEW